MVDGRGAAKLRQLGRASEAATVLLTYLHDPDEALAVLVDGGEWAEAIRTVGRYVGDEGPARPAP